jgi:hypothetical protein
MTMITKLSLDILRLLCDIQLSACYIQLSARDLVIIVVRNDVGYEFVKQNCFAVHGS